MGDAVDLLAGLVLENGRRWGECALRWQWDDVRAVLSGKRKYHFLTRPRGASKTTDLAAVLVVGLLEQVPDGAASYGVAADRDQGRLLLDSVEGFVRRTEGLSGALKVDRWRVTNRESGAFLEVLAADAASAYGLRPHFVVVDELGQWRGTDNPKKMWEALVSAMPKVATSRLVVLTTASDPAHWSAKVLEAARRSDMWRVSEVPGPTPWLDPVEVSRQRELLPESAFRRLHLNEWVAGEDRLTTEDDLAACVTLDGPLPPQRDKRYAIGVDIGLKSDRTVAAVCHLDENRGDAPDDDVLKGARVVLDRMEVWQGSKTQPVQLSEVEAWVLQASVAYNRAQVVLDPWQAVGLGQRLRSRRVRVEEFTFSASSVGRLALTLYRAIRGHRLDLPDDADLLDELATVRLVETSPGSYRIDHDPDRHDDRAIALALVAHWLLERRRTPTKLTDKVSRTLADLGSGPSQWTVGSDWRQEAMR